MTRRDALTSVHEPFGDAFYYGPERLSARYEHDEKARRDSGFAQSTFKTVMDRLESEAAKVRRPLPLFITMSQPLLLRGYQSFTCQAITFVTV